MADRIVQQEIDVARAFSTGVPVPGGKLTLVEADTVSLRLILTFDRNTFPINTPYPRLAVFDKKGAQLVSVTLIPGATGWEMESLPAGRISWDLPGDHSGFASIVSLHPQELEWRLLGRFGGSREITIVRGQLHYTRASATATPPPIDDDDDLASALEMFLQFKAQEPHFYTEYLWGADGTLTRKTHYASPAKAVTLFHVYYTWDAEGLLTEKRIVRISDNAQLVLTYNWNLDDTLQSVTRSAG